MKCILPGLFLLFLQSCRDKDESTVPILSPTVIGTITDTTAYCGGDILSDGGSVVISRGVCWSNSPSPDVTDNKTVDNDIAGSNFNLNITGLTFYTRYSCGTFIFTKDKNITGIITVQ
jgi:hypothetical protein